jgi:hypothetical protein
VARVARIRGLLEPFSYGRGWAEVVRGDQPAAGASFSLTIAGVFAARLLALTYRLVTDANPANRAVTLDYDDGNGSLFAREGAGLVVTASTTQDFAGQHRRGVAEWAANTIVFHPVPAVILHQGQKLQLNVANIQAGDQLSRIVLRLERFPSDVLDYPEGVSQPPSR